MRDHPWGHNHSMLGSAWGTDLTREVFGANITARQAWKLAWKNMLNDTLMYANRKEWGPDQHILHKYEYFYNFSSINSFTKSAMTQ